MFGKTCVFITTAATLVTSALMLAITIPQQQAFAAPCPDNAIGFEKGRCIFPTTLVCPPNQFLSEDPRTGEDICVRADGRPTGARPAPACLDGGELDGSTCVAKPGHGKGRL
jgi:hypothetical protein